MASKKVTAGIVVFGYFLWHQSNGKSVLWQQRKYRNIRAMSAQKHHIFAFRQK
ncbi:MAG: hypothetical protein U5L01_05190 [Rheinheimera sp.]|nr:hypothetical protein [Rheinheimera sp.]